MKKFLSFFAFAALALSMAACSDESGEPVNGEEGKQPVVNESAPKAGLYWTVTYYDLTEDGTAIDESTIETCNMELLNPTATTYDLYGFLNFGIYLEGNYAARENVISFNGDFYVYEEDGTKTDDEEGMNLFDYMYTYEVITQVIAYLQENGYDPSYYEQLLTAGKTHVIYVVESMTADGSALSDMLIAHAQNEEGEWELYFDNLVADNAYAVTANMDGSIDSSSYQFLMTLGFVQPGTLLMEGNLEEEAPQSVRSMLDNNFDITKNYLMQVKGMPQATKLQKLF